MPRAAGPARSPALRALREDHPDRLALDLCPVWPAHSSGRSPLPPLDPGRGGCGADPGPRPGHEEGQSVETLVRVFLPAGGRLHRRTGRLRVEARRAGQFTPLKASFSDRYGRARMGCSGRGGSLHSHNVWGPLLVASPNHTTGAPINPGLLPSDQGKNRKSVR